MKKSILRQPFSFRNKIFFNLLLFLGFSAIIGLSGLYIFLVNSEVKEKYGLREYEKKLSEISKENEKLEVSFLRVDSLDNAIVLLDGLGLEKAENVSYIKVVDSQVVVK
ncbi:MAG: hypothetical protein A3F95_03220 [Candidatus Nealsonbacteria bacterium RIFCSPLOWO2_12_FULL_39_31]|uniref:Uncharacterized protein n=3 Tax=Candidatus Nealsoniibacteriota TaxID=1817911 RepID=A0A1G2EH51_9BACT|nr:MAG: hypothetical protein US88_C0020G0005 [Parcubacteria group bacterium GW2011_GWA2_38_27]KKQ96184.1 MAG: hypothetical protein UT22_C0038G0006 [Parcubacteria group bacterium GW2011_GWC2_39_11]OGZ19393.1 MAG: hypothetical protein A2626_03210 [Candidatus Nealsonbacteria bacterium RIFCSPHIGHO2_01_FULL_38_55]OGZ21588.1 MAG: hypothetical protein A3C48_02885 [Candidatus Nealsonbacteria bacterium RIFCSPHIGHO2_02_FULL_38_75]OGZ21709.1 MAG: hypothetical protein A2W55_01680 [Candidatus Nealsonbacteri